MTVELMTTTTVAGINDRLDALEAGGAGGGYTQAQAQAAYGASIATAGAGVDNAAAINAALNTAGVPGVILGPGTFGISSAIIIPTGKWILGWGKSNTTVKMLAGFNGGAGNNYNAAICSAIGAKNVSVSDLTVDNNKVGNDLLANHKSGVKMMQVDGAIIQRVKVRNISGYGLHSQGVYSASPVFCRNVQWLDVETENCNVHIEQTCAELITVDRFYCWDGDNDCAVEAYLHPLEGSRNITFRNGIVNGTLGAVGVGLAMAKGAVANSIYGVNNIRLENVKVTCKGIAIVTGGTAGVPFTGLVMEDCEFTSTVNVGTNITYQSGKFRNCKFTGIGTSFQFSYSNLLARDCDFAASQTGSNPAFGISNSSGVADGSRMSVRGESSISLTVGTGLKYHAAGEGIYLERDVIITGETVQGVRSITAVNNYYAALEDMEKTISLSWAGQNQSVQIYPHASLPMPIGTRMWIRETTGLSGGAAKTIGAQAGVTINSPGGLTALKAHGSVMLEKVATNTWRMSGDLQ